MLALVAARRLAAVDRVVFVLAPVALCELALWAMSMPLDKRHAKPLRSKNFIRSSHNFFLSVC